MQGLVPAVTSELFGLDNFATNYAIIMLGPAAGAQGQGLLCAPQTATCGTLYLVIGTFLPIAAYSRMVVRLACSLERHVCGVVVRARLELHAIRPLRHRHLQIVCS